MNKSLIKKLIRPFVGKKYQQAFYEKLHMLSLVGMNYALGGDLKFSGEYNALKYIKSKLKNKDGYVIFDVGANIGDYSKACLEVFDSPNTRIFSFEPSKLTHQTLISNIKDARVKIENIGMSDKEEVLTLYTPTSDKKQDLSGIASVYNRNYSSVDHSQVTSQEIKLTTIDSYCEKNNIKNINLLKLDIEGHELAALRGAKKIIEDSGVDFIQFEFGTTESRSFFADFWNMFSTRYNFYRIVTNGLYPIKRYDEFTCEIFAAINFLLEKK
jgi:FkbM family methyltransferase